MNLFFILGSSYLEFSISSFMGSWLSYKHSSELNPFFRNYYSREYFTSVCFPLGEVCRLAKMEAISILVSAAWELYGDLVRLLDVITIFGVWYCILQRKDHVSVEIDTIYWANYLSKCRNSIFHITNLENSVRWPNRDQAVHLSNSKTML